LEKRLELRPTGAEKKGKEVETRGRRGRSRKTTFEGENGKIMEEGRVDY